MKTLFRVASMIFVFILAISAVGPAAAESPAVQLYEGGDAPDGVPPSQPTSQIFHDLTRTVAYSGGPVCLSSQAGQCVPAAIDDYVRISVNGRVVVDYRSYTQPFGPVDFTPFLEPGDNQIHVQLIDLIGPSQGGSQLWLVSGDGGQNGLLQVNAVRGPVGGFLIAKMGGAYSVEVEVHNPTSARLTGIVHLEETGDVRAGDSLSGPREQSVTLNPGETQYIRFDNYVHKWNWLQGVTNNCLNASELIKSVAIELFGSLGKLAEALGNVHDFKQFADDSNLSDSRHKFDYHAYVVTNGQSSARVASSVWVDVPWNKLGDFAIYWGEQVVAPILMAAGFLAQRTPSTAWTSQILLDLGMQFQVASCYSFTSATDPDTNYQNIALPEPFLITSIPDDVKHEQAIVDGFAYLSLQQALYQTTARYEGARGAGDAEWMGIQGRVARKYLVELLYALDAWDGSSEVLIRAARGDNWQLSPEEVTFVRNQLQQGLPTAQAELLHELGFDAGQIAALPGLVSGFLEPDTDWPTLRLPGDTLAPLYAEMITGFNEELAELNGGPIDTVAPISAIQLSATVGNNSWFVSDVTITLTAQDDPGGSGVAQIEWSLDDGRTWNDYDQPFVHSDEGIFHLLVRATDLEGNIEYPPAEASFKVDKTPPIVNVWTDQPQYTRVQPFVVHYSGYDPEPGSGLASLTGVFNGISVTDGQVLDLFWLDLGQYTLSATGEDYAGWVTMESTSIQLIATIEGLKETVQRLCQEDYITKTGICNSLLRKLNSALAAQERGQNKTAVNILRAFQNAIRAQTNKSIRPEANSLLIMDSNYMIVSLGGTVRNK